jgi:Vacuolar protein sorting-associated protein 62
VSSRATIGCLGFLVGTVLGVVVGVVLAGSDEGEAALPDRGRAFSPVPEPQAGELAERFRPWLRFDSGERWRPISVGHLLSERRPDGRPAHLFCSRTGGRRECDPLGGEEELAEAVEESNARGDSTFLDIAGKRVRDYRASRRDTGCLEPPLQECGEGPGSAIYYRVTNSNERFYVDYWWFMRYNHFAGTSPTCFVRSPICGEHEGDWEGVTLVTPPNDSESLDYVVYAAHEGTFRYPAEQLELHDGRRPEVFVANGSHAAYPKACAKRIFCSQPIAVAGVDLPEASTDGLGLWERNEESCEPGAPGSCLLPLPRADAAIPTWVTWPGLWGETCGSRCESEGPQAPASPGLQTRFQYPWCSTQGSSLSCDSVAPGCSDWLGPLVAVLACNPAGVTNALRATEELPAGALAVAVTSPDGSTRETSATTTGVVQALGAPLLPGSVASVTGSGPDTQILVRAQSGRELLEASFEPIAGPRKVPVDIEIHVELQGDELIAFGTGELGAAFTPVDTRRVLLPDVR